MAARLIQPTDAIEVSHLCVLIYGQPGARKTSLAQTADEPITFAFDQGVYRAYGRKAAVLFDTWADVIGFDTRPYKTIVVDTVGMCLDKLAVSVIAANAKNGNKLGGLSLPGFGVLKEQFKQWVSTCRERKQDLVFVAHEKDEKNGDDTYYRPDIVGSSYATLMNVCDLVGYLHFEGGRRVVDFAPSDRFMAKVPPWDRDAHIELPDFGREPRFLGDLIREAKASMGRVSEASAAVAQVVAGWQERLAADPSLADFNGFLADPALKELKGGVKAQVWALFEQHAKAAGWAFDKAAKQFTAQEAAA